MRLHARDWWHGHVQYQARTPCPQDLDNSIGKNGALLLDSAGEERHAVYGERPVSVRALVQRSACRGSRDTTQQFPALSKPRLAEMNGTS